VVALAACGGTSVAPPPPSADPDPARSPAAEALPSPPISAEVVLDLDVAAIDLPVEDLVPDGADLSGSWIAGGPKEAVLVAWSRPSSDPFAAGHGYAVFRREPEHGQWWQTYRRDIGRRAGVLGVSAITADVTGDGADDAVVLEETGGSGACATYRVIDLQAGESVFARAVCDTRIDPSDRPVGLAIRAAVYAPGDAHCCPSAFRTTILVYEDDGSWVRMSVSEEATGLAAVPRDT
jgi:hypothetical protein